MTDRRLVGSALLIMGLSVTSKVLGFAREASLAAAFGASPMSDAYFVALVLPTLVFGFIGQILSTTGVPVFSHYLTSDKASFRTLLWTTFYTTAGLTMVLATVGMLVARHLVEGIAPGLAPVTKAAAVDLSRMMMPAIVFMGLSGWARAALHAHQHFTAPAAVGIVYNIVIIVAALLAWSYGIHWLALATVFAVGLQFGIQIPPLLHRVGKITWALDLRHPGLLRMLHLATPVIAGAGVAQLNFVVDRILASGLSEGTISVLNYALRVAQLPIGLLAIPVVTVLFPTLSARADHADADGLRHTIVSGLNALTFTMLPVTAGLILAAPDVVRVLFERGAFGPTETLRTANILVWYAAGMVFFAWREHLNRAYYALQDTKTPLVAAAVGVGINIGLNLLLIGRYGAAGLAFSTSVATLVHCLLLLWPLNRRVGRVFGSGMLFDTCKMAFATALMVAGVVGVRYVLARSGLYEAVSLALPPNLHAIAASGLRLVVLAVVGALIYAAAAWALRIREFGLLAHWLLSNVQRIRR